MSTSTIQNVEACSQSHNFNNVPKLIIATNQNNNSNWKKWWQCFELFLLASDLEDASEKRKIAIMLHTIGEKANMSSRLTHVRQRLLQETDLTLEKAISIANNVIMAQQNAQTMENSQYSDNVLHISQSYTKSLESSYPVRDVNEESNNDSEQFFIGMVKSVNNDKSWYLSVLINNVEKGSARLPQGARLA
ncbi:uncharacterized protein LOC123662463 [Melitaea cinxia]|uniref:uncharacterized protein LOC123662463 n=1 Tax=Melitaea cinxia TaxID=113334 RepID=UPI001E26FBA8|nr:uncharacterized protein LOC123662463 [Melitaea cinxia]